MLINQFTVTVFTPACSPGAVTYTASARLADDIAPVLPYLNARLAGAVYQPAAPTLAWRQGRRYIVFHPHEIAVSNVLDRAEAEQALAGLIALANATWEARATLTPDAATYQQPTPLAVYRLLPAANCGACGVATCFQFALQVTAGQRPAAACPPLQEARFQDQRAALDRLLAGQAPRGR